MSMISEFRLLIPEEIELSSTDYLLASEWSNNFTEEEVSWQSYLNGLGTIAFEHWLSQRVTKLSCSKNLDYLSQVAYLEINGFKLCLIAQEDFLEEEIVIPKEFVDRPELAAHFYGIVEVVEELEMCTFRGISQRQKLTYHEEDANNYRIRLDDFDPELNHFLADCRYLQPSAIELPQSKTEAVTETINQTITKLGNWLEGVVSEGWQTLDQLLIGNETQLAFATRNVEENLQWGKTIDLDVEEEKVVLLMTLTPVEDNKIRIQVRLAPMNSNTLPANLQLSLKSRSGKIVQSVETGEEDNYIQLKPFKTQIGKIFQLEVKKDEFAIAETFSF